MPGSEITLAYDRYRISLGTEIKYPLLYRVTHPHTTNEHYILGVMHGVPLTYWPEKVMNVINSCTHLFTEAITSFPLPVTTPHNLSAFLQPAILLRLEKDILPLLNCFDIPARSGIDWLPISFLEQCIISIKKRVDNSQPGIDEALVCAFKEQGKPVTMLRENSINKFCEKIQKQEEIFANQSQSIQEKKQHLLVIADQINNFYLQENGAWMLHAFLFRKKLSYFLDKNINQAEIQKELLDQDLVILDSFNALKDNKEWADRFIEECNKGAQCILFTCGHEHLLSAENELSVFDHLRQHGFQVEYCDDAFYLAQKKETKHFTPML